MTEKAVELFPWLTAPVAIVIVGFIGIIAWLVKFIIIEVLPNRKKDGSITDMDASKNMTKVSLIKQDLENIRNTAASNYSELRDKLSKISTNTDKIDGINIKLDFIQTNIQQLIVRIDEQTVVIQNLAVNVEVAVTDLMQVKLTRKQND